MTNLTEKQIEQAQDLIKKYGFCTLETQEELAKAGFFEKVKALSYIAIAKTSGIPISVLYIEDAGWAQENEHYAFIPMPQMNNAWKQLPNIIKDKFDNNCYKVLSSNYVYYTEHDCAVQYSGNANKNDDINETEAMCQLWLKLHKENLL